MDIGVPIRELGPIDMADLKARVLEQEQKAWEEQEYRQYAYDVHKDTRSIVMVFCDTKWPEVTISKEPGWDRLADIALPLMHQVIETHYKPGGTILRAMAAKLKAGGVIQQHVDSLTSFRYGHRIHIPLTTNDRVRFMIDGKPYRMELGKVYEINNQKMHSVLNRGKEDRITFIFDYVPAEIRHGEPAN
ncbi:MAG: hypothetical protein EP340_03600 [Alphaproteobacteria bacterium]|nr:MAG: hypothetical protein EP340_03600 [Alphaproteobacteria bacterium]